MPVHRKRFRIEETFNRELPSPMSEAHDDGPVHREIMDELRAIRAQMAAVGPGAAAATIDGPASRIVAEVPGLIKSYRALVERCEKLKAELDLVHGAIGRSRREMAILHGNNFNGEETTTVDGELGAAVGGAEQATQQILEAAEAIDRAAVALARVNSPDQRRALSEEIRERAVSIFEACNFRDLTGQRIGKVMATMKFIESHIAVMMEIWVGVGTIEAHAAAIVDPRDGDARLLNGPKVQGDIGHASQGDIDALFD